MKKAITKNKPKKSGEIPELLTLMEARDILKCHANTLRQWDKNGILPAIRIGEKRIRRYRKDDILRFLEGKTETPKK